MLKKREVTMSQVTSRIKRNSHNHGIEVSTSLKHVTRIGIRNKNTFWRDTIVKDMSIMGVAFDTLETGKIAPA